MTQDVDWLQYFEHIKPVCPWTTASWKKDQIKVRAWDGKIDELGSNQAIVYICKNYNRRRLKKLCKKLDTSLEYEWLWSEPTNGEYGSPAPILIQQDRRRLFELRFDTGYYNNIIG